MKLHYTMLGVVTLKRNEIINGLEDFKNLLGFYPKLHINHSYNPIIYIVEVKDFYFHSIISLNYCIQSILYSKAMIHIRIIFGGIFTKNLLSIVEIMRLIN